MRDVMLNLARTQAFVDIGETGTVKVSWPHFDRFKNGEHIASATYEGPGSYPSWMESAMFQLGLDPGCDYFEAPTIRRNVR